MAEIQSKSRIDIGLDGSLAMITSSVKENNVMIVQTSDSDGQKPIYKIVTIGADKIQESSSDKSDTEEDQDIMSIDISIESMKLRLKDLEIDKHKNDSKNRRSDSNKTDQRRSPNNNKSQKSKNFQPREKFSFDQHRPDKYSSSVRNRNYNVSDNCGNKYRNSAGNVADIHPWKDASFMYKSTAMSNFQRPLIENIFTDFQSLRPTSTPVDPIISADPPFVNSSLPASHQYNQSVSYRASMPGSSCGLLGDRPPEPFNHPYQQMQGEGWIDQSNSSYWVTDYSNNYQRSVPPDRPIAAKQSHTESYPRNKYGNAWRGRDRRWKRIKAKEWKNKSKSDSSANNGGGYNQWQKRSERFATGKNNSSQSAEGKANTSGHYSYDRESET